MTKKNFESYLNKQNPEIVLFNGHGNDFCVCGFKDEPLIESGKNEVFKFLVSLPL